MRTSHSRSLLDGISAIEKTVRPAPFAKLDVEGMDLRVKLASTNAVGSIKDKPAFHILKRAIERGDVGPDTTIIESSSGNFANALAVYSQLLGLKFMPVIDPNITAGNEAVLRSLCATVVKVTARDDTGGFLKTRIATVRRLRADVGDAYWTNQYENPDNVAAHYALTAQGFCDAFTRLDFVFVGVSSAGTIAGLSHRLKERFPGVQVIAVDVDGSVVFGGPARKRHIPGIGSSVRPALLDQARIDDVVIVSETETVRGCQDLLRRHGVFAGGSTGSVFAAIERYRPRLRGPAAPRVAFIACDRGLTYLDTVYNPAWCRRLEGEMPLATLAS
jgi:2,3-diaminopropionate biosynthesis protein SbnA